MKILVNGIWCDTKLDWGYKTDEAFVAHTFFEKLRLEELVRVQQAEISRLVELLETKKKKAK